MPISVFTENNDIINENYKDVENTEEKAIKFICDNPTITIQAILTKYADKILAESVNREREILERIAYDHIRVEGFWIHKFADQRNKKDWKTTEELLVQYKK